jgi:hypothetical protein
MSNPIASYAISVFPVMTDPLRWTQHRYSLLVDINCALRWEQQKIESVSLDVIKGCRHSQAE